MLLRSGVTLLSSNSRSRRVQYHKLISYKFTRCGVVHCAQNVCDNLLLYAVKQLIQCCYCCYYCYYYEMATVGQLAMHYMQNANFQCNTPNRGLVTYVYCHIFNFASMLYIEIDSKLKSNMYVHTIVW